MKEQSDLILTKPVGDLPVSESLKGDFAAAGLQTIQDALQFDGDALVKQFGFSYHTITELIALLKQQGLESLFKD